MSLRLVFAAFCLALVAQSASACRCAQRTLGEYYEAADAVFMARLLDHKTLADDTSRVLDVEALGEPYKGKAQGLAIHTPISSASCGIALKPGTLYLFFARTDGEEAGVGRVHSCDGTRAFDADSILGRNGFEDVPPDFVVARLTALRAAASLAASVTPVAGRLRGLLDLSALAHGACIGLRAAPDAGLPVHRALARIENIPTLEASYEFPAAIVIDQRPGWYAIRTDAADPAASGWVQATSAGTYWAYPDLLRNGLSYLRDTWDGFLWPDAPGAGRPLRIESRGRETPVEVVDARDLAGSLWLEVQILDPGPCAGPEPRVTHRGWVPAYDGSGATTAWFYSRGC